MSATSAPAVTHAQRRGNQPALLLAAAVALAAAVLILVVAIAGVGVFWFPLMWGLLGLLGSLTCLQLGRVLLRAALRSPGRYCGEDLPALQSVVVRPNNARAFGGLGDLPSFAPNPAHQDRGGQLFFFIHGWPDGPSTWTDTIATLHATHPKAKCVAVALPHCHADDGCNNPPPLSKLLRETDFPAVVEALRRSMIAHGSSATNPAVVIAHDWGASYAFRLQAESPALVDRYRIHLACGTRARAEHCATDPTTPARSHVLRAVRLSSIVTSLACAARLVCVDVGSHVAWTALQWRGILRYQLPISAAFMLELPDNDESMPHFPFALPAGYTAGLAGALGAPEPGKPPAINYPCKDTPIRTDALFARNPHLVCPLALGFFSFSFFWGLGTASTIFINHTLRHVHYAHAPSTPAYWMAHLLELPLRPASLPRRLLVPPSAVVSAWACF